MKAIVSEQSIEVNNYFGRARFTSIPEKSGVYVGLRTYSDTQKPYVGECTNLYQRYAQHRKGKQMNVLFDLIFFWEIPSVDDRLAFERIVIDTFKSVLSNTNRNKRGQQEHMDKLEKELGDSPIYQHVRDYLTMKQEVQRLLDKQEQKLRELTLI
jgi:predicted GIY-YIG superfamily endonuclease